MGYVPQTPLPSWATKYTQMCLEQETSPRRESQTLADLGLKYEYPVGVVSDTLTIPPIGQSPKSPKVANQVPSAEIITVQLNSIVYP